MLRVLAFALIAIAPWALAQPVDELANLKQEQARLRRALDELDQRIRALEGPDAARPTISASPGDLQRSWSEIKPGVPKARVDELLGKPAREMRINGDLVWYYVYPGIGPGSVFFSGENKVTSMQAPRSGWSR